LSSFNLFKSAIKSLLRPSLPPSPPRPPPQPPTLWLLVVLSFDRWRAVCHPKISLSLWKSRLQRLNLLLAFGFSFFFAAPKMAEYQVEMVTDKWNQTHCIHKSPLIICHNPSLVWSCAYNVAYILLADILFKYVLPHFLLIIFTVAIVVKLRKARIKPFYRLNSNIATTITTSSPATNIITNASQTTFNGTASFTANTHMFATSTTNRNTSTSSDSSRLPVNKRRGNRGVELGGVGGGGGGGGGDKDEIGGPIDAHPKGTSDNSRESGCTISGCLGFHHCCIQQGSTDKQLKRFFKSMQMKKDSSKLQRSYSDSFIQRTFNINQMCIWLVIFCLLLRGPLALRNLVYVKYYIESFCDEKDVCLPESLKKEKNSEFYLFYISVILNLSDASLTNIIVYSIFSNSFIATLKSLFVKIFFLGGGKSTLLPKSSTKLQRVS